MIIEPNPVFNEKKHCVTAEIMKQPEKYIIQNSPVMATFG